MKARYEHNAYAERNPQDEEKLLEMRAIIEEQSLIRGFKYVAMDIDDDKCLYLLYKIRKSLKKIQEHNRTVVDSDFAKQQDQVEKLIAMVWAKRGIYPSLARVLNCFLDDEEKADALAHDRTSV